LLRPGGALINVHDLPVHHLIEVHSAGDSVKAGWLLDNEEYAPERSAFDALARVVTDGDFQLEDERDFDFNVHVDQLQEFRDWLEEGWESAVLPDRTLQRLEELLRQGGQRATIVLRVPARMTLLRAI
jgi:hypothetical protein